jgi:hypothetical protein
MLNIPPFNKGWGPLEAAAGVAPVSPASDTIGLYWSPVAVAPIDDITTEPDN